MALLFASVIFFVCNVGSKNRKYVRFAFGKEVATVDTDPLNRQSNSCLRKFYVLLATLKVPSEALLHPQKLKIFGDPIRTYTKHRGHFLKKMPECLRMCKICSIFAAQNESCPCG